MNFNELVFLAKYPFLTGAKEYVNSLNLSLTEMQNHPVYCVTHELARKRVIDSVKGTLESEVSDKISAEFSILSYALARIFANLMNNKILVQKYSFGEANQIHKFLKIETKENIERIIDDVGLELTVDNELNFADYLKYSKSLVRKNKARWSLINREVEEGKVKIKEDEKIDILTEAIREKILRPINLTHVPKEFRQIAKNLETTLSNRKEIKIKELNENALPPCINNMLKSMESGEISHQGMFILGTFFINLGLPKEKILQILSKFPNFSEEKTSYQIDFLSGEKGGTKYTCPGCEKIKFYGLCPEDCGVKHPIGYYYKNRRR